MAEKTKSSAPKKKKASKKTKSWEGPIGKVVLQKLHKHFPRQGKDELRGYVAGVMLVTYLVDDEARRADPECDSGPKFSQLVCDRVIEALRRVAGELE